MSTILKKKQIDLVIENTLKEAGLVTESVEKTVEKKTVEQVEKEIVNESVNNLVNEMKNDTITEGLSKELDTFRRMINYNNY
jgi:predicted sugar kinase